MAGFEEYFENESFIQSMVKDRWIYTVAKDAWDKAMEEAGGEPDPYEGLDPGEKQDMIDLHVSINDGSIVNTVITFLTKAGTKNLNLATLKKFLNLNPPA